jgi:hypothetical protein
MSKYLTAIILSRTEDSPRKIVTKVGTRDEVESYIFEHMDDMDRCKTKNVETNQLDDELTIVMN